MPGTGVRQLLFNLSMYEQGTSTTLQPMRWLVLVSLRYIRNDVRTADGAQSIIRFCCCCRYLLPFDEMTMITHFQIEHFSFIFFPYSAFVLTLPNGLFCVSFLFFLGH